MELQKFFLIVGIPILLLLTVVALSSHGPITGITGFAVDEEKEINPIIGSYSINPSFRAKMDYKMEEEYKKVKDEFRSEVIEPCKISENVFSCFMEKSNDAKWGCVNSGENEPKAIIDDFSNKLTECISTEQDNGVCRFSTIDVKVGKNYEITLTTENGQIKASIADSEKPLDSLALSYIETGNLLYTDYVSRDVFCQENLQAKSNVCKYTDSVRIKLGKEGEQKISQFRSENFPNIAYPEYAELALSGESIIVYKTSKISKLDGEDQKLAQLKFIAKGEEGNFLSPSLNTIIDLPLKKGVTYCYKSDKQVYAFDESDNQVKLRNIFYRFAVTIPNPAPKPIESLKVFDSLKSEKSVILKWRQSDDTLTKSYAIYYAPKEISFIDMKMDDIKKEVSKGTINRVKVISDAEETLDSIDITNCEFTSPKTPCRYRKIGSSVFDVPLYTAKLHYAENLRFSKNEEPDEKSMLIKISIPNDGQEYNFAVTAANDGNIELDNDKSIEGNKYILSGQNYATFASTDDLFPSSDNLVGISSLQLPNQSGQIEIPLINKATVNADGSVVSDVISYRVYYKSDSKSKPLDQNRIQGILNDVAISDLMPTDKSREDSEAELIPPVNEKIIIKFMGNLNENVYYFFVVASDSSGNPIADLNSDTKVNLGETNAQILKLQN